MSCGFPVRNLTIFLLFLGGWPLVEIGEAYETEPYDINAEDGFLTEILYGSTAFFSFLVRPRPDDSSKNILIVCRVDHCFYGRFLTKMSLNYYLSCIRSICSLADN